jgi:hypothetical protein
MKDLINATSGTEGLPNTRDDIRPALVERAAINGKNQRSTLIVYGLNVGVNRATSGMVKIFFTVRPRISIYTYYPSPNPILQPIVETAKKAIYHHAAPT